MGAHQKEFIHEIYNDLQAQIYSESQLIYFQMLFAYSLLLNATKRADKMCAMYVYMCLKSTKKKVFLLFFSSSFAHSKR